MRIPKPKLENNTSEPEKQETSNFKLKEISLGEPDIKNFTDHHGSIGGSIIFEINGRERIKPIYKLINEKEWVIPNADEIPDEDLKQILEKLDKIANQKIEKKYEELDKKPYCSVCGHKHYYNDEHIWDD